MSRGKEAPGRVHEKHQLILADLLREEDNRFCANCLCKGTVENNRGIGNDRDKVNGGNSVMY